MTFLLVSIAILSLQLKGTVINSETGKPVPYAAIQLVDIQKGTYAEEEGRFSLDVPDKGTYTLKVSAIGFEEKEVEITLRGPRKIKVALKPLFIRLREVVVTPGSYLVEEDVGPGKGTLSQMDILMMPGAATDPFWALQTLPGVGGGVDNAVLAIQGGEPDELVVYANGLRVPHPYHYEGEGGGLFSFINESLLDRANLYMAGYPVSFGSALSGALDLKLKGGETRKGATLEMGMAGASLSFFGNNYDLFISRSYTDIISPFFGGEDNFTLYPRTYDIQGIWSHNLSKNSQIALFALSGWDDTGVDLESEGFEGEYLDHSLKGVGGFQITSLLGRWTIRWSLGGNIYDKVTRVGEPWSWDIFSRELENRFVAERSLGNRFWFQLGLEGTRSYSRVKVIFPEDSLMWRNPESPRDTLFRRILSLRGGAFLLGRFAFSSRWFLEAGIRGDYLWYNGKGSIDPRLSVAYRDSTFALRLGGGFYHQDASYFYLDSLFGNPNLPMMQASHAVFSLERRLFGSFFFESQLFFKRYSSLPVDTQGTYLPLGKGRAYGFQFLLRRFKGRFSGWVAYTFSRSKRARDETLKEYPSGYDYPHIFSLVGQVYLGKGIQGGVKLRYATGGPYTPILGSVQKGDTWIPIVGETNSERFPDYFRMDVRITRLTALFGYPFVFYLELLNVTDRKNVTGWSYTSDYEEKKAVTFFGFLPVAGVVLFF